MSAPVLTSNCGLCGLTLLLLRLFRTPTQSEIPPKDHVLVICSRGRFLIRTVDTALLPRACLFKSQSCSEAVLSVSPPDIVMESPSPLPAPASSRAEGDVHESPSSIGDQTTVAGDHQLIDAPSAALEGTLIIFPSLPLGRPLKCSPVPQMRP